MTTKITTHKSIGKEYYTLSQHQGQLKYSSIGLDVYYLPRSQKLYVINQKVRDLNIPHSVLLLNQDTYY